MTVEFEAVLIKWGDTGGWHFAPVPPECAPPVQHGWGRTSVVATVDGHRWATSTWREKSGRTLLPVPKAARGGKGAGDVVSVRLEFHL